MAYNVQQWYINIDKRTNTVSYQIHETIKHIEKYWMFYNNKSNNKTLTLTLNMYSFSTNALSIIFDKRNIWFLF